MQSLNSVIRSAGNVLIPWRASIQANRIVAAKIDRIMGEDPPGQPFDYMQGYEKLTADEIEEFFEKTIDTKSLWKIS